MPRKQRPAAVDLFCGAGGLSYGMQRAGIRICAGIDNDPDCRHPFERNVKADFYERDISDVSPRFISSLYPRNAIRILAGCAPCQPFSCYSRTGRRIKMTALSRFAYLVKKVRPDIVTMENVPGLEERSIFRDYVQTLHDSGYELDYQVIDCSEFGVPQIRRRLVLLASKLGQIDVNLPRLNKIATVRSTISGMSRIRAGGVSKSDRLHRSSRMSHKNMERIKSSVPGGTWRDWKVGLRAPCHTKKSGRTYPGVYGRMEWDMPSPTITTQFHGFGSGRFGHPTQHRAISLREGALLQTFPKGYSFVPGREEVNITKVARMIGNAVPVKLAKLIGRQITRHLEEHDG